MKCYAAYGLRIRSSVELPELPVVDGESADVVIRRGDVEPVPEWVDGEGGRRMQAAPGTCRVSYDGIGSFGIEAGERILLDPESAEVTSMKVFRRLLQNEMMGLLLHQRGLLVLHASAVAIDGTAVVFLGPRHAGKSTTAAAFHGRGHTLLEDDVVGVRIDDEGARVLPGVPQMRLRPDAADALGVDASPPPPGDSGPEKRYQRTDEVRESAPLGGCYCLEEGDELRLEEVPPREQLLELISKTYTAGLLEDTETIPTHFEQCSAVLETTRVQKLERPQTHQELPGLVDLVVEDVHSSVSVLS